VEHLQLTFNEISQYGKSESLMQTCKYLFLP